MAESYLVSTCNAHEKNKTTNNKRFCTQAFKSEGFYFSHTKENLAGKGTSRGYLNITRTQKFLIYHKFEFKQTLTFVTIVQTVSACKTVSSLVSYVLRCDTFCECWSNFIKMVASS